MKQSATQSRPSSRHAKITGDFAEGLVLYWLSKHGCECARVDHTGLDLIARVNGELMGLSVKARSRHAGNAKTQVMIERSNVPKLETACAAFGCKPYFAVVVDADSKVRCFIMSMDRLVQLSEGRTQLGLPMNSHDIERYESDSEIIVFRMNTETLRWWSANG